MHFYGFNVGSYIKRTHHLTLFEDLAYRRLLDRYYITEAPLQGTPRALARAIDMREHAREVRSVLSEFFVLSPEGWRQDRCDNEIAEYRAKVQRNRENGKRGGRPKATESEPSGLPDGWPPETQTNLRHSHPQNQSVGGREGAAPAEPETRSPIAEALFDLGVLRLSAAKRSALAEKIAAGKWTPGDLRALAASVTGKTDKQRAARLAGLLQDDANRDLALRAATSDGPPLLREHPQNMPAGIASCGCEMCVKHRAKRNGGAA